MCQNVTLSHSIHYIALFLLRSQRTMPLEDYNFTLNSTINGPVLAVVLSFQALTAFAANFTVLSITLYQRISWKQPSTIFFTSFILAHLQWAVIYLPMSAIAFGAEEWIFGGTFEEKQATCSFAAFISLNGFRIIEMTLAAISVDRFLFIVKPHLHKRFMGPWVALTLTIAIWVMSGLINSAAFLGYEEYNCGWCTIQWGNMPWWYTLVDSVAFYSLVATIIVTTVWTFCFTHKFIRNQSVISGESLYTTRKIKLFGIFGSMLLVYVFTILPITIISYIDLFNNVDLPDEVYAAGAVSFLSMASFGPLIQSYFRPEIKVALVTFFKKCHHQSRLFKVGRYVAE